MAQTGDPTGTGTGKSDLPNIPAEFTSRPSSSAARSAWPVREPGFGQQPVLHLLRGLRPADGSVHRASARWCRAWMWSTRSRRATAANNGLVIGAGQDRQDAARRRREVIRRLRSWSGRRHIALHGAGVSASAPGDRSFGDPDDRQQLLEPPIPLPEGCTASSAFTRMMSESRRIDRLGQVFQALQACWSLPLGASGSGQEATLRLAFRRDGTSSASRGHLLPVRPGHRRARGLHPLGPGRSRAMQPASILGRLRSGQCRAALHLPFHRSRPL